MKKYEKGLLIISSISLVISLIGSIVLWKSYEIAMNKIANSEYFDLYSADVKAYHTYVILLYILLFLGGVAGIVTYLISSKWWVIYIPCTLCILLSAYISTTKTFIPLNIPVLVGALLLIFIANAIGNAHKKIHTFS